MSVTKTDLEALMSSIGNFPDLGVPTQTEFFLWYHHAIGNKERVSTASLLECFDQLHLPRPANIGSTLAKLSQKKPARVIKDKAGYRLSAMARQDLQERAPVRSSSVVTTQLLRSLADRISNSNNHAYLEEAITCFNHKAFRGAVIMTWNLAYSDLLDRIFSTGLDAFNGQVGTHNFKRKLSNRFDFSDLRESDVIKISRAARLISGETLKILEEKLGKRNSAAHPSGKTFTVAIAEEFISDLVDNLLLKADI